MGILARNLFDTELLLKHTNTHLPLPVEEPHVVTSAGLQSYRVTELWIQHVLADGYVKRLKSLYFLVRCDSLKLWKITRRWMFLWLYSRWARNRVRLTLICSLILKPSKKSQRKNSVGLIFLISKYCSECPIKGWAISFRFLFAT